MTDKQESPQQISCIGKDKKIHSCLPWEDKADCGAEIGNKKPTERDIEKAFSCYACTY
tara:strand:+ start:1817 stop:1990 length:174 start_codon:yes stop_codon:yes gene_type:complete